MSTALMTPSDLEPKAQLHDMFCMQCRRSHANAQQVGDKALWETQLVALQDTKNLTVTELERLRVELVLKRREASFQEQRHSGQAKIKQLQVPLSRSHSLDLRELQNVLLHVFAPQVPLQCCHIMIQLCRMSSQALSAKWTE